VSGYVNRKTLRRWMKVSRRFYLHFGPALLPRTRIFLHKGFNLMANSASILVLSQASLKWEAFLVQQVGEDMQTRQKYFAAK
jgi:hypothetical protein